jgi:hypothetical protein
MVQARPKEPIADDRDAVRLAGAAIGEEDAVGIDKFVPERFDGIGRIKSNRIPLARITKSSGDVTRVSSLVTPEPAPPTWCATLEACEDTVEMTLIHEAAC